MFFGARHSDSQLWMAKESKIGIEVTPVAREAFVFFVEADNPVDDLTTEQFRAIYHGSITNTVFTPLLRISGTAHIH